MAKSTKSHQDDKKRKTTDIFRVSDEQLRAAEEWLKADIAHDFVALNEFVKGDVSEPLRGSVKARAEDGVIIVTYQPVSGGTVAPGVRVIKDAIEPKQGSVKFKTEDGVFIVAYTQPPFGSSAVHAAQRGKGSVKEQVKGSVNASAKDGVITVIYTHPSLGDPAAPRLPEVKESLTRTVKQRVKDSIKARRKDGLIVGARLQPLSGRSDFPAVPGVPFLDYGVLDKRSKELSISLDEIAVVGGDVAEFKAGIERMAKYHAKTKALYTTFLKDSADSAFVGALAGNKRKNKLKRKNENSDSGEIKKAH